MRGPKPPYRLFEGPNIEQIPILLEEGFEPASTATIMDLRLKDPQWLDIYLDSGDLALRHPDGGAKIVPYDLVVFMTLLNEIAPHTKLLKGSLPLPDGMYESLAGLNLTKRDVDKYTGRDFTEQNSIDNIILKELARTPDRLFNYTQLIHTKAKEQHGSDQNMGIYLANPEKVPTARFLLIRPLVGKSQVDGTWGLDGLGGRILGISPDAQPPFVASPDYHGNPCPIYVSHYG